MNKSAENASSRLICCIGLKMFWECKKSGNEALFGVFCHCLALGMILLLERRRERQNGSFGALRVSSAQLVQAVMKVPLLQKEE